MRGISTNLHQKPPPSQRLSRADTRGKHQLAIRIPAITALCGWCRRGKRGLAQHTPRRPFDTAAPEYGVSTNLHQKSPPSQLFAARVGGGERAGTTYSPPASRHGRAGIRGKRQLASKASAFTILRGCCRRGKRGQARHTPRRPVGTAAPIHGGSANLHQKPPPSQPWLAAAGGGNESRHADVPALAASRPRRNTGKAPSQRLSRAGIRGKRHRSI